MDDLEGVLDDANGHELFAVVAAVHHERAAETLDNGAQGLAKAFHLVATSRVGYILGGLTLDRDVVLLPIAKLNSED